MRQLIVIAGLAMASLLYACSKKNDPVIQKPDQPTAVLAISDFNPKSAMVANTVMITGSGFGMDTSAVTVAFGNSAKVKPATVADNKITVIVPKDAETGKIHVFVKGQELVTASDFTLTKTPPPVLKINAIYPRSSGQLGATITLSGSGFGSDTNFVSVSFGGSPAIKPKAVKDDEITVIVPLNAKDGKIAVSVNGGKAVETNDAFTLTMSITGFSPRSVTEGDTMKITGILFGTNANVLYVTFDTSFGDGAVKAIKATNTQIQVIVPAGAKSGNFSVHNTGDLYNTEDPHSPYSYTFTPRLLVAAVDPESARAGEFVKINGDFNKTDNINSFNVRFFGSKNDVKAIGVDDHNNLIVRVPSGALKGKITVTKTGLAAGSTYNTLTVLPPLPPIVSGVWTERPDHLFNGLGQVAFTIGTKAYASGGSGSVFGGFGNNEVWEYDQAYDSWRQLADFGGGRFAYGVAFTIGNKGYIATGLNGSQKPTTDLWEYDPEKDVWTKKASFIGVARAYAVGFTINGKGYVGAGNDAANKSLSDFYEYDPANDSWKQIQSLPVPRSEAYAFAAGGNGYVGGGRNGNTILSDFYMYSPASNTWTKKTSIPGSATYAGSSFSVIDKGYVVSGFNGNLPQGKCYQYTPSTDSWKVVDGGHFSTLWGVGFSIGGIGYCGGGTTYPGLIGSSGLWAYKP